MFIRTTGGTVSKGKERKDAASGTFRSIPGDKSGAQECLFAKGLLLHDFIINTERGYDNNYTGRLHRDTQGHGAHCAKSSHSNSG